MNLEKYGVQELSHRECSQINGGDGLSILRITGLFDRIKGNFQMKNRLIIAVLFYLLVSSLNAQEIQDSVQHVSIPFVEIYSDQGDLIGQTDCKGKFTESLNKEIFLSKTKKIYLVHPLYVTTVVDIAILARKIKIQLSPIEYSLDEVTVYPQKQDFKYLKVTAYFRSLQINNDLPQYFMDGKVEYYINQKSRKTTIKIIGNRSFENEKIKQLDEKGSVRVSFILAGVPYFEKEMNYKNLAKDFFLTSNGGVVNIKGEKSQTECGSIKNFQNNKILEINLITEENPKIMGGFGNESVLYNEQLRAAYQTNNCEDINEGNVLYFKMSRNYKIKNKHDRDYQKVDVTHEFFFLNAEYTNQKESNYGFYTFKPSENEEVCVQHVQNPYYQELPCGVMEYIKRYLTKR